jgi:hypothetical protein
MADDSLKPPLTRRIPGAARSGPRSTTRPVLPEAVLKQMQAAVDAARASRDNEHLQRDRAADFPAAAKNSQAARSVFAEISRPVPVETAAPSTRAPATPAPETTTPEIAGTAAARPIQIWPPAETGPRAIGPPATSSQASSPPATVRVLPVPAPQRPAPRRSRSPRRRGPRVAGAAALAVILFASGAVAATLWARASGAASHGLRPHSTRPHSTPPPSTQPPSSPPPTSPSVSPATVTANLAATWVARQVSHNDYVACDKAMCDALTARGFPGRKLKLIRPNSPYPLLAQIMVETPLVAHQFGSNFATKWAPAILTRVGSGAAAIFIRIVSAKGAASYNSALSKDVQQRKASAQHLLGNAHVKAAAAAKNDLAQGRVDARLIVVLTALAAVHPIEILGFGDTFAGASRGIPLRVADLAPNDAASRMKWRDYVGFLRKVLAAQPTTYRPQSVKLIPGGVGKLVFQIEFSAPSPLGIAGP